VKLKGRAGPAVGRATDRFLGMVFFFLSFLVKKKDFSSIMINAAKIVTKLKIQQENKLFFLFNLTTYLLRLF
jgi:hypothetical protein